MTLCRTIASFFVVALAMTACTSVPAPSSVYRLAEEGGAPRLSASIPAPLQSAILLPRPQAAAGGESYSVVVNNTRAQDLLFALARDAKLNIDIHPGIEGVVTLNAIDQTLPQLLQRIAKQVDIRWETDGHTLIVMPDTPFLRTYKVDYVNLSREATGTISASSQITSTLGSGTGGATLTGNVSTTKLDNVVKNQFWLSLEKNIKDILRETDKLLPEGSSETVIENADHQATTGTGSPTAVAGKGRRAPPQNLAASPNPAALQQEASTTVRRSTFREAAAVIVNAETGIVSVRATSRQHEKIQEFIDQVSASARRQVMIEASIVEVELSSYYQQGINWSRINRNDLREYSLNTASAISTLDQPAAFVLTANDGRMPLNLNLAISLLNQFGTVKVLSSPKLSVLNNQSAVLKVVENFVYFTVKEDVASSSVAGVAPVKAFTTTPQSVSVGLVMSVTPQISDNTSITLNIRPSITSVSGKVQDPNPDLTAVKSYVPTISIREIESMMRLEDGEIAVLGGLMQEKIDYTTSEVPGLGAIPILGELFKARDNVAKKSELVIFLRPVVVRDASMSGDYKPLRKFLPQADFLKPRADALPLGGLLNPVEHVP